MTYRTPTASRNLQGRGLTTKRTPKDVRDLIRRHLKEEKKQIKHDLAAWWGVHPHTAYRRMYDKRRPFTPSYIEAVITGLQLDEFDANELRLFGARDAGWLIDPNVLLKDQA